MRFFRSSRDRYQSFLRNFGRCAGAAPISDASAVNWRGRFRPYIRWLKPHRHGIASIFLFSVAVGVLQMIEPQFMRWIIDDILLKPDISSGDRMSRLHWAGGCFLAVMIISSALSFFRDQLQHRLNSNVVLSLRRSLHHRLLRLPITMLSELKVGGIISRLSSDIDATASFLNTGIISPATAFIRVFIAVVFLVALSWRLALLALFVAPGPIFITYLISRRVKPIYHSIRQDSEQISSRLGEVFSGIRVVRAFRGETLEQCNYVNQQHTTTRKQLLAQKREQFLWVGWGILISAVNVMAVWYGGWLSILGRVSIGEIMAFQWYIFLLLNPLWTIVVSFSELQRTFAALERVFDAFNLPLDKPDEPDAADAPTDVHELQFQNVSFEYRAGCPVLHKLNLVVPGGAVVALVGRSGAGKTTISDLIARFHDPTEGNIFLNGRNIRSFRIGSYRRLFALVSQDVFLFDGTIRENIRYANKNASDSEIEHAARSANAHDFIAQLPERYETIVGERGTKLSGGQKQRIAIARAFLAAPKILILDEATSNLDTESEQLIQSALNTVLKNRTTFIIAHRLSTIRRADIVLLLHQGRILERGTHEELMAANGEYCGMVRRQDGALSDSSNLRYH